MDLLFRNTTQYTKQLYLSFLDFHKLKFGAKYQLYNIFIIIILISFIIMQLSYKLFVPAITLLVILVCFILYRYTFSSSKISKELKSKKISEGRDITFNFYDHHFEVSNESNISKLNYRHIYRIFETDKFFYIYIDKNYALILRKDGFSIGNSIEFSDFLKRKCFTKFKQAQV